MSEIRAAFAREILDSRGDPALEVEVELESGVVGRASVPSEGGGAALRELRDGDRKRCRGRGLLRAIDAVCDKISPELEGRDPADQLDIDRLLTEMDGTPNCEKLGANVLLGVSLASARAAADELGMPLYRALGGPNAKVLPVPMIPMIEKAAPGGEDAPGCREVLIRPVGVRSFREAAEAAMEIRHRLRDILAAAGSAPATGERGSFVFSSGGGCSAAIEALLKAVDLAGYRPGDEISLAIDFGGAAELPEKRLEYLERLLSLYPLDTLLGAADPGDRDGWRALAETLGDRCRIIGGARCAPGTKGLADGIREGLANAVLIDPILCGTVTEVLDAVDLARRAGCAAVLTRALAETDDDALADLAVAGGAGEIAAGAIAAAGCIAKYSQLLRIEEELEDFAVYGV